MEREPGSSAIRDRMARSDAGGLLYGAIVTAAVLVTVGGHDSSVAEVMLAWAIVLGTYWMTHVYVVTWKAQFHGDSRHLGARLLTAGRGEATVLVGGIPPITVFMVASFVGLDAFDAERIALYFTVLMLAFIGFVGARYAGRHRAGAWREALGAGLLGLVMVAAKSLLH